MPGAAAGDWRFPHLEVRMTRWETFSDPAYFNMWCVRPEGERRFNHVFHLVNGDEARGLVELLNASAIEARSDATGTGAAEGESAAREAGDAQ
jgi:hypothetical protein